MLFPPLIGTLIRCTVVALVFAQPYLGAVAGLVMLFLIFWFINGVGIVLMNPPLRKLYKLKAGLWLLTAGVILLANLYYHHAARSTADAAVAAILDYRKANGVFPESLQATALKEPRTDWPVFYSLKEKGPSLRYHATYTIFPAYYHYDFEKRNWYVIHY